jgi:hypothetical protein
MSALKTERDSQILDDDRLKAVSRSSDVACSRGSRHAAPGCSEPQATAIMRNDQVPPRSFLIVLLNALSMTAV